jgi:alkylation response protein AidB-like acyl-CoA dehydrogenase
MHFAFTEEQLLFQGAVRDLLAKEFPAEELRAVWSGGPRSSGPWAHLAEMGVPGLVVPSDQGGLGLDEVDLVLLLEETGRVALAEPVVETAAVAARILPDVAAGETMVAVGLDPAGPCGPYVAFADIADVLVLQAGDELHAVPLGDVALVAQPCVDGARRIFSVSWTPSALTQLEVPPGAAAAAFDRGAWGTAAQLLGVADRMIEMTADYAREREQFGKPIGSFQAVKHLLADALLKLEFARPVVYRAAWSVARGGEVGDVGLRARDVSMAKAYASEAAVRAARVALQVHGAIGYTWEHDLHLWMKRAWALASAWGDARLHRERVAGWLLGPPPASAPAVS